MEEAKVTIPRWWWPTMPARIQKGFTDDVPAATAVFHHKEERPDMPK
jgi:hypothetical protein